MALCAVLLVWWVVGNQWNRLRMRQALTVLRPVLRELGAQPTARWHGSAACEVQLGDMPRRSGLRGGAFLVRLLPRDVPLAWALRHWRGRRDRLDLIWQAADAAVLERLLRPDLPALLEWHVDAEQGALRAAFALQPGTEAAISDCLVSVAAGFRQQSQHGGEVSGIGSARPAQRGPEGER